MCTSVPRCDSKLPVPFFRSVFVSLCISLFSSQRLTILPAFLCLVRSSPCHASLFLVGWHGGTAGCGTTSGGSTQGGGTAGGMGGCSMGLHSGWRHIEERHGRGRCCRRGGHIRPSRRKILLWSWHNNSWCSRSQHYRRVYRSWGCVHSRTAPAAAELVDYAAIAAGSGHRGAMQTGIDEHGGRAGGPTAFACSARVVIIAYGAHDVAIIRHVSASPGDDASSVAPTACVAPAVTTFGVRSSVRSSVFDHGFHRATALPLVQHQNPRPCLDLGCLAAPPRLLWLEGTFKQSQLILKGRIRVIQNTRLPQLSTPRENAGNIRNTTSWMS